MQGEDAGLGAGERAAAGCVSSVEGVEGNNVNQPVNLAPRSSTAEFQLRRLPAYSTTGFHFRPADLR